MGATEFHRLNHKAKCLLKVSGGPDSVYLFHEFLRLKKERKLSFAVVHFNHHLREKESDADAHFVKSLCKKYRIPCFVFDLRFTKKTALQQRAREKRYTQCRRLMLKHGFSVLVTGHHRDDFIETVIMNAHRGAGISGLAGIRLWQEFKLSTKQTAMLYRPLIGISKSEILKSLQKRKLSFRIDASNKSDKYLRNRVRANELAGLSQKDRKKIFTAAIKLQQIDDEIEKRVGELHALYSQIVPLPVWQKLEDEVQFRFFAKSLARLGFKEQVERRHFELFQGGAHAKLELGPVWAMRDDKGCYFVKKMELECGLIQKINRAKPQRVYLAVMNKAVALKQWVVIPSEARDLPGNPEIPRFARDDRQGSVVKELIVDPAKIKFPLTLSFPKLHQKFLPCGREHEIPLKKLFQAKRFGIYERLFCPVLTDGRGRIVAVIGVEIADEFKLTSSSLGALRISPLF